MKKTQKFESLSERKFRTAEARELRSVMGSAVVLDTLTVTDSGSVNDHQDYPIDRGADM
jgi:hypothetical protein